MSGWKDKYNEAEAEQARIDVANGEYNPPSHQSFHGTAMEGRDEVYDTVYEAARSGTDDGSTPDPDATSSDD